jgi:hypothetical protein
VRQPAIFALALGLSACSGGFGAGAPPIPSAPESSSGARAATTEKVYDASTAGCTVSYEGFIWYRVPASGFPPIDVKQALCGVPTLKVNATPALPRWSIPHGTTQTRFVATSITPPGGAPSSGMSSIENAAVPLHVPVSWMIYSPTYLGSASVYNGFHHGNGDDAEGNSDPSLIAQMKRAFSWYVPSVSVEGVDHERNIRGLMKLGERAFWGIAWNSHGVDGTYDYGAPWGSYCADPTSYKRPQPSGACTLLAFEWTARDLTRAYLSGHEEYFSTDPDDLQRALFSGSSAETYIREIADSYAAAGELRPIVMMSQQEAGQNTTPGDAPILTALYDEARKDGMKLETLAQAAVDARTFSAAPRAVAFPYIPGGINVPSTILGGQTLYPATIDYHDTQVGMTFLAGHTLPTRIFRYADDPVSRYNRPLAELDGAFFPALEKAAYSGGDLILELKAPIALHTGIALWADPRTLGIAQTGALRVGHAGEVIIFDVAKGINHVTIHCPGCKGTTLPYSL